jgi:hypothetical protein
LLRAGHGDYVINAEALAYMRERHLAGPVIDQLRDHNDKIFADVAVWSDHLDRPGIAQLKVQPDAGKVATEGAIWDSIQAHCLLQGTVILSDDAGQFRIGEHGLCWVHAERLVHKLIGFNAMQRQALDVTRQLIWWFYRDLNAYKNHPGRQRAANARPVRSDLYPLNWLRHARSIARPPAWTQGRVVAGPRATGDPTPYEWVRERHSLSRHQA